MSNIRWGQMERWQGKGKEEEERADIPKKEMTGRRREGRRLGLRGGVTLDVKSWYTVIALANRDIARWLWKEERLGGQVDPGENSRRICGGQSWLSAETLQNTGHGRIQGRQRDQHEQELGKKNRLSHMVKGRKRNVFNVEQKRRAPLWL